MLRGSVLSSPHTSFSNNGQHQDHIDHEQEALKERKQIIKKLSKHHLLIALLAALLFLPFLGGVHLFDWDENNFAEIAREMILTDTWARPQVDFLPFWEKPPLFFWMQAGAMKLFGVGEYAARFPNAICGILTLLLLFDMGKKMHSKRMGLLWVMAYAGSILPHLYFKSGIIDPWFNLFIFAGLHQLILFSWQNNKTASSAFFAYKAWKYLFVGGLLIGLGILTKGPVAYLIICLTLGVYWILNRFRFFIKPIHFILFSLAVLLPVLLWFVGSMLGDGNWGLWFAVEFLKYQFRLLATPDAGHGGFPGYHLVVLLLGCFPASIFTLRALFKMPAQSATQPDYRKWMLILLGVVVVLFSIVQSKIVHYSSLAYFPLTYLAALSLEEIISGKIKFSKWMKWSLLSLGGLLAILCMAIPWVGMYGMDSIERIPKDAITQEVLKVDVAWTGWESVAGLFLLIILIIGVIQINRNKKFQGIKIIFGGTAIFLMLALAFFIGKAEQYSQRAAISFFEAQQGEDVYVLTYGYKSYAHLFYSQKQPPSTRLSAAEAPSTQEIFSNLFSFKTPQGFRAPHQMDYYLKGEIDKDVYISARIHRAHEIRKIGTFEELGSGSGYVFFRRKVGSTR